MSDHESLQELAASFALGALDEPEREAFEEHIATCDRCRAEVRSYREVGSTLAWTAPPIAPPPSLRDRVLREAQGVRPLGAGATRAASPPQPPPHDRRPHERRGPWLAAAAALLLAIGAGALYLRARTDRADLAATVAALRAQNARNDSLLARLDSTLARRDSLLAILLAPDVETVALTASGQPPSARLYWNRARGRIIVAALNLAPAPAGRTYQLWGIPAGGSPISLGTFDTETGGQATVALEVPPGTRFDVSAVTEEPDGGSPQPTTTPFLFGTWPGE